VGVIPLAFGVASATAASGGAVSRVNCTTRVSIAVATGESAVTPPVAQGSEYGIASCGKLLGVGVQADTFTVADSGNTVARYALFFPTGAIHGSYVLTPQETAFNFLEVDYTGTITIKGGTGAFQGMSGTGKMTCVTLDGIHTTCRLKLKLKG
jgi:hypothetical protein